MIILLILGMLLAGLVIGFTAGAGGLKPARYMVTDYRRTAGHWLAVHLMPAQGEHGSEREVPARHVLLLAAPEEAAPVTSPAGAPRTALVADAEPAEPVMSVAAGYADEAAAVQHWGPPIDVFASMALNCEQAGVPWPAAERPARVAPTMFRDDTGSQPAIPEQHRATQPIRLPADDTQAAEMRAEYFGQPAGPPWPCCRHCADGGGRCFIPDTHEVACMDCHAPVYGEAPQLTVEPELARQVIA